MDPGEIVVHEVQGYRMGMVGEASRARAQGARSRPLNPPGFSGFSGFFPGRIAVLDRLSFFSHPFLHVVFSVALTASGSFCARFTAVFDVGASFSVTLVGSRRTGSGYRGGSARMRSTHSAQFLSLFNLVLPSRMPTPR